jgi:L-amino acid N-acyltransferase
VTVRRARPEDDRRIAAIWNAAIASPNFTTDTEPRTPARQRAWLAQHGDDHPVVVAVDDGEVVGYGSLSPYRDKPAFRATVENSVYVDAEHRGRGVGARILAELIRLARERGHHALIARIIADNAPSRRLHERLGFTLAGLERETAFKHGRWLDVCVYQLLMGSRI